MKRTLLLPGVAVLAWISLVVHADDKPLTDRPEDEKPVRALLASFSTNYNAAKAEDLVALFTDDGALVNGEGEVLRGRAEILAHYKAAFAQEHIAQLQGNAHSMRFLTPDVAQIDGEFGLYGGKSSEGDPVQTGRFSVLAVRKGGQWKLAEVRDYPDPAPEPESNYHRLSALEWMVGDWIDESENIKSTSSIRWAENKNFLVRTYAVHIAGESAMSGTQWIGWDPQTGQIKSWVFDSEGGHGTGLWTQKSPGHWTIKNTGTLRDGRATSSTQVINVVNKDAVRLSATDRVTDGQSAADIGEVIMVRKPPAPAAAKP